MVAHHQDRRICRFAPVAALAALLTPSLASAEFGTPFPLSSRDFPAAIPQVAADSDGDALVVWEQEDSSRLFSVTARARSNTGAIGPLQILSATGPAAGNPRVAMDADGDALVAWHRFLSSTFRVQARARAKTGALGPLQTLSGPNATNPEVAMDSEGDALVAWARAADDSRVQARARSRNGVLGPIENISAAGGNDSSYQVAMDADGDALIIWVHPDGGASRLQARFRSKAGALGPIQDISDPAGDAGAPRVAMDADGDALIVWSEQDGTFARRRTKAGALGPIEVVAGVGAGGPQVATEPDGDAVVVWSRNLENGLRIEGRTRSAAGALGPVRVFSKTNGLEPQVSVDPAGNAVAIWVLFDGTNRRIQARTLSAAGVLGPRQTLTPSNMFINAAEPQVAMDGEGDALAVWRRNFSTSIPVERIEAAAGP